MGPTRTASSTPPPQEQEGSLKLSALQCARVAESSSTATGRAEMGCPKRAALFFFAALGRVRVRPSRLPQTLAVVRASSSSVTTKSPPTSPRPTHSISDTEREHAPRKEETSASARKLPRFRAASNPIRGRSPGVGRASTDRPREGRMHSETTIRTDPEKEVIAEGRSRRFERNFALRRLNETSEYRFDRRRRGEGGRKGEERGFPVLEKRPA
jgi:hypothetical protein